MRRHLPRALAAADEGVLTRRALVDAGADGDLGDRLVRQGAWQRLAPSVYLTTPDPPTDAQLVSAARHHAGAAVVVTGLVACRALGLADVPDEPVVEVFVPPGTRVVSSRHVVVHQSDRRGPTWTRGEVAYAAVPRAVVDGGRRLTTLRDVRALLLGAVCSGRVCADDLTAEVEAGAQRGSGLVRRAADDARAGAWSAPEAEAAQLVSAAVRARRLPPYLLNPVLQVDGVRVGRPDGWLVGTRVGWQVDSRRHHAAEESFDRTLATHDAYAAHGLTLLHVTPRRLRLLREHWVQLLVDAVSASAPGTPAGLVAVPVGPLQTGRRPRPALPGVA